MALKNNNTYSVCSETKTVTFKFAHLKSKSQQHFLDDKLRCSEMDRHSFISSPWLDRKLKEGYKVVFNYNGTDHLIIYNK